MSKESKQGILRSLFASSIFLIFLKPVLEFMWKIFVKASLYSYSTILDEMYRNAALGQRNWIAGLFALFCISIGCYLMLQSTFLLRRKRKLNELMRQYRIEKDETKINNLKVEIEKKKIIKPWQFKIMEALFMKYYLILEIPLVALSLFFIFFIATDLQLNTSFDQRLNAISPYVSDYQYKTFKSKWAMMKTRKDFELINTQIEIVGQLNKLNLPPNLLP